MLGPVGRAGVAGVGAGPAGAGQRGAAWGRPATGHFRRHGHPMTQLRIHPVRTERVTLTVRERGRGEPLVLLHGWPESGYCWTPVLPHLDERFRVICPDLRGLGDSERTAPVEDYRKAQLAADVLAVLDAMGVERFGLAGHDWGGAVAQVLAASVPARVRRLCLLNIFLFNNPTGLQSAEAEQARRRHRAYWYQTFMQMPGLCEALVEGHEEAWLRAFLRGKDRDWAFPADAVAEYVRAYRIPGTATSGANYYRAMPGDTETWRGLRAHRFPMPTLLLFGVHDPVVLPACLDGYERCFDQVELRRVEASHFLQEERPEVVGPALNAFFTPLLG